LADTKISALAELTALAAADELVVVDKSDTTMAASGTDKRVTLATLRNEVPFVDIVAEYGAVAGSDSTTAIQNAIDAVATAGGGIVYVPPTSSNFRASQIRMKDYVWLLGAGRGSGITSLASNPNPYLVVLDTNAVVHTVISDLEFLGDKANQTDNGCIHYDHTSGGTDQRHQFRNLFINQFEGNGIHMTGPNRGASFFRCFSSGSDGHGFVTTASVSDMSLVNVISINNGLDGFHFANSSEGNRLVNCKSGNNGQVDSTNYGDGYYIDGNFLEIVGCEAQSNLRHGWHFKDTTGSKIGSVASMSNAAHAYRFDACSDMVIQGVANDAAGVGGAGPHTRIVELVGTANDNNTIDIQYKANGLAAATAPVNGDANNNRIIVGQGRNDTTVTFATSLTPDPYLYEVARITLTDNITFNAPTYQHRGQRLRFILTQDGTGGRTMTFNAVFKTNWGPSTAASAINVIEFECDGTNWHQVAATTPAVQTYTVSNVTTDRTYNANSYTMDELADVLGTLIGDLQAKKLIG
jgi:hypothetical protein